MILEYGPVLAEIKAAQAVRGAPGRPCDETAWRRIGGADLAPDQELGCRAAGHPVRILDAHIACRVPVAINREYAVAMGQFAAQEDMATPAPEREASRAADGIILAVTISRHTG